MSISTRYWPLLAASALLFAAATLPSRAQNPPPTTESQAPAAKPDAIPDTPAQIDLLETKIRFESNGDSRKEVHTVVRINSELGARQFSHLNFNFNRAYEKVEIPLVHITHKSGGSADILPSAITDQPNAAVADYPAYQDVRVKSIRILGLEPSDVLEYRVITTTTHPPLAPNFWLEHSFDRTGVVTKEIFELDLPNTRDADSRPPIESALPRTLDGLEYDPSRAIIRISPAIPPTSTNKTGMNESAGVDYRWEIAPANLPPAAEKSALQPAEPDVAVSTFKSWSALARTLVPRFMPGGVEYYDFAKKLYEIEAKAHDKSPLEAVYEFVSQKIRTVDLPLGATGFGLRKPSETLSSGYGTPEDKIWLYAFLARPTFHSYFLLLVGGADLPGKTIPSPAAFSRILIQVPDEKRTYFLDPNLEVAPYGMIAPELRSRQALTLWEMNLDESKYWTRIPDTLPFSSTQRVTVDATIAPDGTLDAKIKYFMRGDNELLLRVAFHQSPRDKWKEVAQLMSLSDGFRGKIVSASASDPTATKFPFTVEYEISQPKFVDWSKKPVRIPAPLPLLSVPDLPGKAGNKTGPIDLGNPLDVETRVTVHLPPGTSVETPTGTVVDRDYATYASRYDTQSGTVTATRHIHFLHRNVDANRTPDYAAFLHAVQTDQAQLLTLTRADAPAQPTTEAKTHPAKTN